MVRIALSCPLERLVTHALLVQRVDLDLVVQSYFSLTAACSDQLTGRAPSEQGVSVVKRNMLEIEKPCASEGEVSSDLDIDSHILSFRDAEAVERGLFATGQRSGFK